MKYIYIYAKIVPRPSPQSGLVFNAIFATLILSEPFTQLFLFGTILVFIGAVLIATYGAIPEPSHSLDDLLVLLGRPAFLAWLAVTFFIVLATIAFLRLVKTNMFFAARNKTPLFQNPTPEDEEDLSNAHYESPRMKLLRGLLYGLINGILAAHSLLVAKSAVELLVCTFFDGNNQFNRWQSWAILLSLGTLALVQLYYMNCGLKLCSTVVLYPFCFCVYNVVVILDGLIYFHQGARLSPLSAVLITLGTVILLLGVLLLFLKLNGDDDGLNGAGFSSLLDEEAPLLYTQVAHRTYNRDIPWRTSSEFEIDSDEEDYGRTRYLLPPHLNSNAASQLSDSEASSFLSAGSPEFRAIGGRASTLGDVDEEYREEDHDEYLRGSLTPLAEEGMYTDHSVLFLFFLYKPNTLSNWLDLSNGPFPRRPSDQNLQKHSGSFQPFDGRRQREAPDSSVDPTSIKGSQAKNRQSSRSPTAKLTRSSMYPPLVPPHRSRSSTSTSRVTKSQLKPTEPKPTPQAGRDTLLTTKPLPPEPQETVTESPQNDYKPARPNNKRASRLPWRARHIKGNKSEGKVSGGHASHYAQRFTEHLPDGLFRRPSPAIPDPSSAVSSNTPGHSRANSTHDASASIAAQSDILHPTVSNTNRSFRSHSPGHLSTNRKGLVRKLTTRMHRKSKKPQSGNNWERDLIL